MQWIFTTYLTKDFDPIVILLLELTVDYFFQNKHL